LSCGLEPKRLLTSGEQFKTKHFDRIQRVANLFLITE
jgi:hypothetical protein